MASSDAKIAEFTRKFLPELEAQALECRRKLHALIPRGFEMVYDNYNALVFGFAATAQPLTEVVIADGTSALRSATLWQNPQDSAPSPKPQALSPEP
jgi:hypothetical protein